MGKIYKTGNEKNLIVTDEYIAISSKKYLDFDEMKKKAEMISFKSDFKMIHKKNAYGHSYNLEDQVLKILFASENNLNDSIKIYPTDSTELIEISDLIGTNFSFEKSETTENKIKYLVKSSFSVLVSILASFVFFYVANSMKNGVEYSFSGRKSALSQLFMRFINFIGPIGTLIIGLLVIGFYMYKLVKRYKNPSIDVVFKRPIGNS